MLLLLLLVAAIKLRVSPVFSLIVVVVVLFSGCHGSGLCSNTFLVLETVLTVNSVSLCLGRVLDVRLIQQILDSEQNLFDGDGRAPVLLFVQQRQTNGPGRVHVRMEQWRFELALGRTGRVVILEDHPQLVQTAFPWSSLLSRNSTFPRHKIQCSIGVLDWTSNKSKGMIFTPCFSFFAETRDGDSGHFRGDPRVSVTKWPLAEIGTGPAARVVR